MPAMTGLPMNLRTVVGVVVLLMTLAVSPVRAGPPGRPVPSRTDKCPVCGMFVYKYPDFMARVAFKDGSARYFDGAKDMFKYLFAVRKYDPGKRSADVSLISVTEYYRLTLIDARKAWYVIGSDVYGPMGRELIPFEKKAEAEGFMSDHRGRAILRFGDITAGVIKGID